MKNRSVLTLLIPLMLILLSSLVYATWQDNVTKTCNITAGKVDIEIGSWKRRIENDWVNTITITQPDEDNLEISAEVSPGWYIWIGLIIHNKGTLPVMIDLPTYTIIDSYEVWNYFTHKEYFYGPYHIGDEYVRQVWDGIILAQFDPEQGVIGVTPIPYGDFPIQLDPCHKLIAWEYLYFSEGYTGDCFTIQITVTYTATQAVP